MHVEAPHGHRALFTSTKVVVKSRIFDSVANEQTFFSGKSRGRGRGKIRSSVFLSAVAG